MGHAICQGAHLQDLRREDDLMHVSMRDKGAHFELETRFPRHCAKEHHYTSGRMAHYTPPYGPYQHSDNHFRTA